MNQKGVIGVIVPVILVVVGIVIAVYLSQNPQVFRPKATETPDISFESHYNPFGDLWNSKNGINPDIPVTLTTGCYRRGPKWVGRETDPAVSDEEIAYLAKSNTGLVFEECAVLQGPNSNLNRQRLINIATKLKQVNPNAKYIGYHVFWQLSFDPQFATDIYTKAEADEMCGGAKCESFFIHKKGLPATKENRLAGHYLDITNPHYRQYIAPKIAQTLNEMNMDGFLADGVSSNIPGVNPSEVPEAILNNWALSWADLFRDVKAAIGPNKLLFSNSGGMGAAFNRPIVSPESGTNLPRADGLMWEDPLGPLALDINSSGRLNALNSMLDLVNGLNKYLMIVVNTNVNCTNAAGQPKDYCYNQTSKQQELNFHKYYLAAYLNIFRTSKTTLLYYNPLPTSSQFDSESFYRDWDLKIGQPTSQMQEVSPGVFMRTFQKAHVYWNNSNGGYTAPGNGLYGLNGSSASQYSIPPKSGGIYVTQQVLTDWNQSTAAPSSSPVAPQMTLTAFTECYGGVPAINMDFTDIGKEYTVEISPAVSGVGINNGALPGRLTLRPLRIYDAGINGIRALNLNTTYTLYILATTGERSNSVTVTTPASCTNPSPSPILTTKPAIIPESTSSYCQGTIPRNHLQWTSVPGAVIYKVFRQTDAPGSGIKIGETSGIALNDDQGTPGVQYTYGIEADNSSGSAITSDPFKLTTQNCTQAPSPSISPSASPARKIGDIDNNGRVDIFDFNLLVGDYRSTNMRSDLNKDNKVDLFDFNLLVTNFGK